MYCGYIRGNTGLPSCPSGIGICCRSKTWATSGGRCAEVMCVVIIGGDSSGSGGGGSQVVVEVVVVEVVVVVVVVVRK